MIKRPSQKLPDEVVQRAILLRQAGQSYRDIAETVGHSVSAIHGALRGVPDIDNPKALTADEQRYCGDLAQDQRDALLVHRALLQNLGLRAKLEAEALRAAADGRRKIPKRTITAKDIVALERTIVELRKLEQLTRGNVISRSEVIHRTEPEPTPDEKAEMERLRKLWESS